MRLVVGNGSALGITHTGFTSLPLSSRPLSLNGVLYVPDMERNLISVRQLCFDNKVSVMFDPWSYQVRDLSTGALLKTGTTKNGMYEWLGQSPPLKEHAAQPLIRPD